MQRRKQLRCAAGRPWRGIISAAAGLALPLGGWWIGEAGRRTEAARLRRGLTVVLPGIEGRGALSWSIFQGILDGGFPGAVILWDWTTGLWPFFLFHLRAERRNRCMAVELAQMILGYQSEYPGRPVYLVGHSGGAAMAAWAMESLPQGRAVTETIMLGPALSPSYPLGLALQKVQGHLWNFWSPLDLPLLGGGTQRRHRLRTFFDTIACHSTTCEA